VPSDCGALSSTQEKYAVHRPPLSRPRARCSLERRARFAIGELENLPRARRPLHPAGRTLLRSLEAKRRANPRSLLAAAMVVVMVMPPPMVVVMMMCQPHRLAGLYGGERVEGRERS
jgi:hypothetical protein